MALGNPQQIIDTLNNTLDQIGASPTMKPTEAKRLNDIRNRLEDLKARLSSNQLSPSCVAELSNVTDAIVHRDYSRAQRHHTKLVSTEWQGNDRWLPGVKTMLLFAKKHCR